MTSDPIQSAMHAALGTLFARMSRSQWVTFVVDGQRYDVACAAGDTARTVEASLRCAVAARKAGGMSEIGDWKQDGNGGWYREGSPVQAYRAGAYWGTCPHTGTTYSCPDAAREAADAHLVSQGRLPAERAFVRLGEWEDMGSAFATGRWVRRQSRGAMPLTQHASCDKGREEGDAHLVSMGWLDPSRAFKATTENTPNTMTRIPPERHNSVPPEVARAAKPVWSHNGSTQTTVMPLGGSTYTIPTGYSPEHVASKINADTNAPVTATVKHGAISLEQKAFEPAKPAWGEWVRRCGQYLRCDSDSHEVVAAYPKGWMRTDLKLNPATDIDDAREKADAWLVARGELEAGRAFVRLTDWTQVVPGGAWHRVALHDGAAQVAQVDYGWGISTRRGANGSMGPETGDAGKAAADAELVRRGLLAEERAFKMASAVCVDSAQGGDYGAMVQVSKKATGVYEVVALHTSLVSLKAHTVSVALGADGVCSVDCTAPHPFMVQCLGNGRETSYRIFDAYGASHPVSPGDRLVYRSGLTGTGFVTKGATKEVVIHPPITLANWEHHLPALLANAPREFRDGFNRRQGPAWEAYLRGLAGVREEIQCRKLRGSPGVTEVVLMATTKAHIILGPYWIDANVVGKR